MGGDIHSFSCLALDCPRIVARRCQANNGAPFADARRQSAHVPQENHTACDGRARKGSTMAEVKTKPTDASVEAFIAAITDPQKRTDCKAVARLMQKATGAKPKTWGASIVGFGSYQYVYDSGRTGDWMSTGFSPRAQALTLYIMSGFSAEEALMKNLGKYKTGKSCLYIERLAAVDLGVLERLLECSVEAVRRNHPAR
jgi:hypothetical protein